jgi:hypothetical protein
VLLKLNPKHLEGLISLGRLFFGRGDLDQAIEHFRAAAAVIQGIGGWLRL